MAHHRFTLSSGRSVGVSATGDPMSRRLVVACHPAIASGPFDPNPIITNKWGVHIVMLDRPGYGSSDPVVSDSDAVIEQRADDIAEFIKGSESVARKVSGIQFESIGVIGWGLGGAVALSLAGRHSDLVDSAVVVDLPKPARLELVIREQVPWAERRSWSPVTLAAVQSQLTPSPRADVGLLGVRNDDPALVAAGLRSRIERMAADAYEQGAAGVAADVIAAQSNTWSSALSHITAQTTLVYGGAAVGVSAERDGRWYRRHIAGARVARVHGAHQLAIVNAWGRILSSVDPNHGELSIEQR